MLLLSQAKVLAKSVVPIKALRTMWENMRDWTGTLAFWLSFVLKRRKFPKVIIYFGYALGDDLLCTAVLRELRRREMDRLLMISDHGELFMGNSDPMSVRPLWRRYSPDRSTEAICRRFVRIWGGEFKRLEYAPVAGFDRRIVPSRHIVAEMCARAGVTGSISIRPYFHLGASEKSAAEWASGRVVIQSSGLAARHAMLNKQWPEERYQEVVDALRDEINFVQLGAKQDTLLEGVQDLRGVTSIRETAAILHHARLYVGSVGFLMHLARAVECPSTIIFGGREAPWQSGYLCNLNLYSGVPCAPCWRTNTCDFGRKCLQQISVSDVVSAIREMLRRPRSPLAVESAEIEGERAGAV